MGGIDKSKSLKKKLSGEPFFLLFDVLLNRL